MENYLISLHHTLRSAVIACLQEAGFSHKTCLLMQWDALEWDVQCTCVRTLACSVAAAPAAEHTDTGTLRGPV